MTDADLHVLYVEWAAWVRSKRLFAPSPNPQSVIGCLVKPPSERDGDGKLDPQIAALHLAILGVETRDGDLIRFEYLIRPYRRPKVPVKRLAGALGFSRQRWYQLVRDARRRVYEHSRGLTQ